jgi:hypothetical protein
MALTVVYRCECGEVTEATLPQLLAVQHFCRRCELVIDLDLADLQRTERESTGDVVVEITSRLVR